MFIEDRLKLNEEDEVNELKNFLKNFRVDFDIPDTTYVVRKDGKIIATGSIDDNILKYFFLDCNYSGQGVIKSIFNKLQEHIFDQGYKSYFAYTTPYNKHIFESLGLREVCSTDKVSLLEGGSYNIEQWIEDIRRKLGVKLGNRGAIVANCNPMTLGHKYLITEAMESVDQLLVFVVEEDVSDFPFEARYEIVKEELKAYDKIKVLKGGPYIISKGTFPTYFTKKKDHQLDVYTQLDATIFAEKIAKGLAIDTRFIGTENQDLISDAYNSAIIRALNENNLETRLIARLKIGDKTVSATKVRRLIGEGKVDKTYKFLTSSTKKFLNTKSGKSVIQKIINENAT